MSIREISSSASIMTDCTLLVVYSSEMDRERRATVENKGRGLGCMGAFEDQQHWYGGKIHLAASVSYVTRKQGDLRPPFKITLLPLAYGISSFHSRLLPFGVMRLGISGDLKYDAKNESLRKFLAQKFVLSGRVFIPFVTKEDKAYLMQTDENYERCSHNYYGDQHRIRWRNLCIFSIRWISILTRSEAGISANQSIANVSLSADIQICLSLAVGSFAICTCDRVRTRKYTLRTRHK